MKDHEIERQLERYEETLRESAVDRVEERFERMSEEVEERTRRANEHLHGAILDGVVRKALKELRQQLEAEAEEATRKMWSSSGNTCCGRTRTNNPSTIKPLHR